MTTKKINPRFAGQQAETPKVVNTARGVPRAPKTRAPRTSKKSS